MRIGIAKWCSCIGDRSSSRVAPSSRKRSTIRSNCVRATAKLWSLATLRVSLPVDGIISGLVSARSTPVEWKEDRAAASAARTVRDSRSHRPLARRLAFESLPNVEAMCGPHVRATDARGSAEGARRCRFTLGPALHFEMVRNSWLRRPAARTARKYREMGSD